MQSKAVSGSPNTIAFPYQIRRSGMAMAAPLGGSEASRGDAILEYLPWRGLSIAAMALASWALVAREVSWSWLEWGWLLALTLGLAACLAEGFHRRDGLTEAGLEGRSGILGRRRVLVPYNAIELVTVHEPGRGSSFDVGTVIVRSRAGTHRLVGIAEPYKVAEAIESAVRRAG